MIQTAITGKRLRILLEVQARPLVQEMMRVEPAVYHLLRIAALQSCARERWYAYEALKALGSQLVGHGARVVALQTARHYEAYLGAIDALLPDEDDEELANEERTA